MPIYEYRCEACGKRSTALLPSWASPNPVCPHCGASKLERLVSTFASPRSRQGGESPDFGGGDFGGGDDDFGGGDDDFSGGGGDFGGGGDYDDF